MPSYLHFVTSFKCQMKCMVIDGISAQVMLVGAASTHQQTNPRDILEDAVQKAPIRDFLVSVFCLVFTFTHTHTHIFQ